MIFSISKMLFLIVFGSVFSKVAKLKPEHLKKFGDLIHYILMPCLIINIVYKIGHQIVGEYKTFLLTYFIAFCLFFIAFLYSKIRKLSKEDRNTILVTTTFVNCGYLGIPAAFAFGGKPLETSASFFAIAYAPILILFSSLIYEKKVKSFSAFLAHPYVLAFVVGLIFTFSSSYIDLSSIAFFISKVASITSFAMLLLVGASLVVIESWKFNFLMVEGSILRLLSGLLVFGLIFGLGIFENTVQQNMVLLQITMPSGMFPYFIALQNKRPINNLAGIIVSTTILWFLTVLSYVFYLKFL